MKLIFTARDLIKWLLLFCCIFSVKIIAAQSPAADTVRVIQILQGKSLREKTVDSLNSFQTIAGNVILKEGFTIFSCDSASINKITNVLEAFGNIHINQQDSIHTYSQYMRYVGKDRMAFLKKDVKLTDKKGILYTQELEYDLRSSIGKYKSGGKVVNGKTILTSEEGTYYADTKDVFFKRDVHLVDPKYDIRSDSLQYNTQTQLTTFITDTYIKSKEGGDIFTKSGTYDLKNGKAFFGSRSIIKDSTRIYTARDIAYDEASGIAQLEGNAIIKDSVSGYTVLGGQIFSDRNKKTFLATRKPVLIFKGEGKDSTFIAADTLFSGVQSRDSVGKTTTIKTDTLKKTIVIGGDNITVPPLGDSMTVNQKKLNDSIVIINDSTLKNEAGRNRNMVMNDSIQKEPAVPIDFKDSLLVINPVADTLVKESNIVIKDSAAKKNPADTIRYFLAFHHVRIFNDSLQSVCDSLYYSSADSIFRLFNDPVVFSSNSQVSGDTIHLYTKNKKADRIHVIDNALLINKAAEQVYNQIAGREMNGYFKEGNIDYMRTRGQPAESVFYPQDDDSAFTGMNRSHGDVIDIFFINKEVNKVKFINEVDGIFFPIRQVPADQKYLPNFEWLDKRRPKNKLELFE